jgi:hypothetical protein
MGKIYFSIALLALYGDIVKRFVPPVAALGIVYALAICILVMIASQGRGETRMFPGRDAQLVNFFVSMLVVIYIFQLLTSFDAPLFDGFSHLLYMVIPLSYIIVVQKYSPQFSLDKLARPFLWMMIPINIVGVIQFAINPHFLISTAYGGVLGGVIERNLLEGGFFNRFPSIFASADRYSAIALMQFYFSWALLTAQGPISRRGYLWLAFNMLSSLVALGVAGARSRILIVFVVVLLVIMSQIVKGFAFSKVSGRGRKRALMFMFSGAIVAVFGVALTYSAASEEYPILLFLQQSFSQGDIQVRVGEAGLYALHPDDVSLFGKGLGTIGVGGKPGEGIQSTWAESGLVWGSLILFSFLGIIAVLARCSLKAALKGQGVQLVIRSLPLLVIVMGLLVGLTSAFELSTGILLGCAIAVAVRRKNS